MGYLNDSVVGFAEFPYGQGRFLLHANPIVFSNFSLLRAPKRGLMSKAPGRRWRSAIAGGTILSQVPEAVARRRNRGNRGSGLEEDHPLTFILKQPALAWAWYLLAGLAGAWLFFRAKRRQRIIPVLPKNENSSYEFISTIANLHFRERDYQPPKHAANEILLAHLRERYGVTAPVDAVSLLPRTDDEFFRRLAKSSEVPEHHIRNIFTRYTDSIRYEPTEQMMVDLHLAMEGFFKRAK